MYTTITRFLIAPHKTYTKLRILHVFVFTFSSSKFSIDATRRRF
jgi:hypothetical protein